MIRRSDSYFTDDKKTSGTINKSSGVQCRILMLDRANIQLEINKKTTGQWVFDFVIKKLNITQGKFFGFLYEDEQKDQQWLELSKPVKKHTKRNVIELLFCVKFYPVDPMLVQTATRSQMYWQVKKDFLEGRLPCSPEIATKLCGYIAQAELCDWLNDRQDYLITLGLLDVEFHKLESEIIKHHRDFKGMTPINAMTGFLDTASGLEFYGMVFYDVKYQEKLLCTLGLSPHGFAFSKEVTVIQSYAWSSIVQVSYKGKHFTVKVNKEWTANGKPFAVNFAVDSSRTCRALYLTFIEYINFYKVNENTRPINKGSSDNQYVVYVLTRNQCPDTARMSIPSSVSTEGLSQLLLQSIEEEERKRQKQQLHRSLSLPRKSVLQTQWEAQLTTKNAYTNQFKPVEGNYMTSSDSLDDGLSTESHDSLLDLADDLGDNDNESITFADDKPRSSSNPDLLSNQVPTNHRGSLDAQTDSADKKKKNRLLVQSWVNEQKKKEENLLSTTTDSLDPPKILTLECSPPRPYKLKLDLDTKRSLTPSYSPKTPQSYYRPNSAGGFVNSRIEDLYSVPRLSHAPSPCYIRKPHPFSTQSNNLLIPSTPYNDYDTPRSLIDLRRVDSLPAQTKKSSSVKTTTHSESSLTGSSGHIIQDSFSSIPAVDQASQLKEEYPDYDVPRSIYSLKDYPDYDIPKPSRKSVSSNFSEDDSQSVEMEGNSKMFGVLDSIMAEIDDSVAAVADNSSHFRQQSLPSLIDDDRRPKHVKENSTPVVMMTGQPAPTAANREPAYDRLSAKIALQKLIADGIVNPEDVAPAPPEGQDNVNGDKSKSISLEKVHEQNEDVVEPLQIELLKPKAMIRPPDHLYDLSKQLKLDTSNDTETQGSLPFDPNFFARQMELEKQKQSLPPQVAKFMSRVKPEAAGVGGGPVMTDAVPTMTNHKDTLPLNQSKPVGHHREPIYQEINELAGPVDKPKIPMERPMERPVPPSPSLIANAKSHETKEGKENQLKTIQLQDVPLPATLRKDKSLPRIQNQLLENLGEFGGKRYHSFNARRPLQIKLDSHNPTQNYDEESIPNSPSFYTVNPMAAAMPHSRHQHTLSQQDFTDQLTKLDTPPRHHHVAKWIKGAEKFWDEGNPPPSAQNGMQPAFPRKGGPQHNRAVPQSIPQSLTHGNFDVRPNRPQSNQFKDHLYEDPDVLVRSFHMQRKGTSPALFHSQQLSQQFSGRPRTQSLAAVRRPYVTREVQRTIDGGTVYATDV